MGKAVSAIIEKRFTVSHYERAHDQRLLLLRHVARNRHCPTIHRKLETLRICFVAIRDKP